MMVACRRVLAAAEVVLRIELLKGALDFVKINPCHAVGRISAQVWQDRVTRRIQLSVRQLFRILLDLNHLVRIVQVFVVSTTDLVNLLFVQVAANKNLILKVESPNFSLFSRSLHILRTNTYLLL